MLSRLHPVETALVCSPNQWPLLQLPLVLNVKRESLLFFKFHRLHGTPQMRIRHGDAAGKRQPWRRVVSPRFSYRHSVNFVSWLLAPADWWCCILALWNFRRFYLFVCFWQLSNPAFVLPSKTDRFCFVAILSNFFFSANIIFLSLMFFSLPNGRHSLALTVFVRLGSLHKHYLCGCVRNAPCLRLLLLPMVVLLLLHCDCLHATRHTGACDRNWLQSMTSAASERKAVASFRTFISSFVVCYSLTSLKYMISTSAFPQILVPAKNQILTLLSRLLNAQIRWCVI